MQDAIPVALLELATGYQRSQVLFALVELAVPTLLSGRAMKLDDLASALDLNHRAADMFLSACAALGLLDCSADGFVNSPSTETFLVEGRDTYLGHLVSHYDRVSSVIWTSLASNFVTGSPILQIATFSSMRTREPNRCERSIILPFLSDGRLLLDTILEVIAAFSI